MDYRCIKGSMKLTAASIDIETTHLKPIRVLQGKAQILQIGIKLFNHRELIKPSDLKEHISNLPTLDLYIDYPEYTGDAKALAMNSHILDAIADYKKGKKDLPDGVRLIKPHQIPLVLAEFFKEHGLIEDLYNHKDNRILAAGKNFGSFDLQFINNTIELECSHGEGKEPNQHFEFRHRSLDVGSMLFERIDNEPPSLKQCLDRVGLTDWEIPHRAVEDAEAVIACILKELYDRNKYTFYLSPSQIQKAEEFKEEHDLLLSQEQLSNWTEEDIKRHVVKEGRPYRGAIGGGFSYKFTPTTLGTITKIIHNDEGQELDISDYDYW